MQDLRQQRQDKFVSGRYDYLPGQWRRQAQRLLDSRSETAHCGRIDFDGLEWSIPLASTSFQMQPPALAYLLYCLLESLICLARLPLRIASLDSTLWPLLRSY